MEIRLYAAYIVEIQWKAVYTVFQDMWKVQKWPKQTS